MPLSTEKLRGTVLNNKPDHLCRCGMSNAKYAQHRETKQWYELSEQGNIIGSPLQLDFYSKMDAPDLNSSTRRREKVLANAGTV